MKGPWRATGSRRCRGAVVRGRSGRIWNPQRETVTGTTDRNHEISVALTGLVLFWHVDPGRRSPTRFALGYYLSGFQPIQFEPRDLGSIDESQNLPACGGEVRLSSLTCCQQLNNDRFRRSRRG